MQLSHHTQKTEPENAGSGRGRMNKLPVTIYFPAYIPLCLYVYHLAFCSKPSGDRNEVSEALMLLSSSCYTLPALEKWCGLVVGLPSFCQGWGRLASLLLLSVCFSFACLFCEAVSQRWKLAVILWPLILAVWTLQDFVRGWSLWEFKACLGRPPLLVLTFEDLYGFGPTCLKDHLLPYECTWLLWSSSEALPSAPTTWKWMGGN